MSLSDHQAAVAQKAQAPAHIVTPADRDRAIAAALLRYSQDRPRRIVADVTADAAGYRLPLPAGWVARESAVLSIEMPVGAVPASMLAPDGFALRETPSSEEIVLGVTVALGDAARITFAAPHALSASVDTVPARDREALACWAAALLCDQVAAHHAENREPTIQADRVDYTSATKEWGARAKAYRALYFQLLGIDTGPGPGSGAVKPKPAGEVVNLDVPDSRLKARLSGRRWR